MIYQQDKLVLDDAVSTASVVFETPFSDIPEFILVTISNSVDGSPLVIGAIVTASSETGFSVKLSAATDSANYSMSWIAGAAGDVEFVNSALGVRVTELTESGVLPSVSSLLPFVDMSNTPTTKVVSWGAVSAVFGKYIQTPPAAPTSPGDQANWSVDANFFYSHDGFTWGRVSRRNSRWDLPADTKISQSGTVALALAAATATVVFPEPFQAAPHVTFFLQETTVNEDKVPLSGLVVTRSTTGFSVLLNSPTPTSNYHLYWMATGEPEA